MKMSKFKLTILVYTIIVFGASILLWSPSSRVPIMPSAKGTPLYSLHPYFTAELLLMLSTVTVCVMAMLISLYSLRRQGVDLIRIVIQNYSIISLAVFTVIVAICGCLTYSQLIYMGGEWIEPPTLYESCYGFGILFCEGTWIMIGLLECLKHLKKSKM